MALPSQSPFQSGIPLLPARRLIALDPGSHSVKVLVVEEMFGRLRVLRQALIELEKEGLATPEEINRHLRARIEAWSDHPITLIVPQHRAVSQVITAPSGGSRDVRTLIEEETVQLSGLSESAIVYDYVGLKPFGRHTNPFWVTLCQEAEIQRQIDGYGLQTDDLCEVTTTANALVAAFLSANPEASNVILADVGASRTVVALLLEGQCVYATSFPVGGDALTERLAAHKNCSLEAAENLKRSGDLASDRPDETGDRAELRSVIDAWEKGLTLIVEEWLEEHAELRVPLNAFQVVLSGGAACHPGLLKYLNRHGGLKFAHWPDAWMAEGELPSIRFAAAYGAALQALGRSRQTASLLPSDLRASWRRQHSLQLLHSVSFFLVGAVALMLVLGTWQKLEVIGSKKTLLGQSSSALEKARATETLTAQASGKYERLRPVLQRNRQTLDTLETLAHLQQVRSNQSYWYVLFADQQSYFSAPVPAPAGTNQISPVAPPVATNPPPSRYGFIAELCLPEEGEAMRRTLSQVVAGLKPFPLFRNVDSLSDDRKRNLIDAKLVVPDRHFPLAIELAENRFAAPARPAERRSASQTGSASPGSRPASRPANGTSEHPTPAPSFRDR